MDKKTNLKKINRIRILIEEAYVKLAILDLTNKDMFSKEVDKVREPIGFILNDIDSLIDLIKEKS